MVKKTIRVEADTLLTIRKMAESEGRRQSDLIRDVLNGYIRRTKQPLPSFRKVR
jgi:hypothetical protein